ncbi:LemA family protein [Protaetiibacter mangrovi]|uniref:LemA family protein n=1 Tax=Protaetiibacter mangrovi TaxID=2970926 RepID=A0ABT1ZDX5_9MICO|nr:LemA family protein [Protaetiibacter mangrovi]MCS0498924.1 LemA family protein [Protaetiibacter mangrovi]TPX03487.1 LemA family protein [Schumannella luteola]
MDPLVLVIIGVAVVVVVIVGVWLWSSYHGLVKLHARVDDAWGEVTAQLERRAEVVPGLVGSVSAHASHEGGVVERVSAARGATVDAGTPSEAAAAEERFQAAVTAALAVAEGYPKLQSDPRFLQAQTDLVAAQDGIQAARRAYNGSVREFNAKLGAFPSSLFVRGLGYGARDFFEVSGASAVAEPPRVQF